MASRWHGCAPAKPSVPPPPFPHCCRTIRATCGWRWAWPKRWRARADARFESLATRLPNDRAVALTYAGVLVERNTPEAGARAQSLLRPMLRAGISDPVFQRTFARVSEIAGDPVRAGEAWAEAALLSGRAEQALVQLNTLRRRDDLDYYARARIDARIAAITPIVLELRRQGVRDEDLRRY